MSTSSVRHRDLEGRIGRAISHLPNLDPTLPADSPDRGSPSSLAERMAHYRVPGASIAVVENYELAWARGFGEIERGSAMTVTPATLFESGSVSKFPVAVAALRLVERGVLALDRDINEDLVSWKVPDSPLAAVEKVTLRRLLTHTSGIPSTMQIDWDEGQTPTLAQVLRGEPPAGNEPVELRTVPGREHHYANAGYAVLQQLLEDVVGLPLDDILRREVFGSVGMDSSTYVPTHPLWTRSPHARPHLKDGTPAESELHPSAFAQGGLLTTPTDLAHFARDLMLAVVGRSQLLSERTANDMLTPQVALDPAAYDWAHSQGLGVFLAGPKDDLYFVHPGFATPGASAVILGHPSTGFAIAVQLNAWGGQFLELELAASILAAYGRDIRQLMAR